MDHSDYKAALKILVKDNSSKLDDPEDYDFVLDSARDTYSRHKAKRIRVDVTADGTRLYDLPNVWETGFSEKGYQIEYPVDDSQANPVFLTDGMSKIIDTLDGDGKPKQQLRFIATRGSDIVPPSGSIFRLYVPIRYVLTDTECTIPDSDAEPVQYLAASKLLEIVNSRAIQNSNGSTDVSQSTSKSEYLQLADRYYARYKAAILPSSDETKAAGVFGDFTEEPYNTGAPDFFPRTEEGRKYAFAGTY